MATMKAVLVQNKELRIDDMPRPEPGPYQCLCKTLCAATCNATDKMFLDRSDEDPKVLGHESVGRVIEVGGKVRNFKEGDIVLRPTAVYPGLQLGGVGCGLGGFSEYGLVTDVAAANADGAELPPAVAAYSVYQQIVPPSIDPKDATMMITLKETLSWSQCAGVAEGKGVLIFGDGPVGQSFVRDAKILGASPIAVVGHWPQRLEKAKALGADIAINRKETPLAEACEDRIADVVIDAVGNFDLINEALPLMREEAVYTIYGIAKTPAVTFDKTGGPRTWSLRFLKMDESETHDQVIGLIESGELDCKAFYDLVLPMERAGEAMEKLAKREANKIVLEM